MFGLSYLGHGLQSKFIVVVILRHCVESFYTFKDCLVLHGTVREKIVFPLSLFCSSYYLQDTILSHIF
jgi:hypothetical protein